jgi:mRNA deadenylase 3'-5' endonuclease subunit Ccr4
MKQKQKQQSSSTGSCDVDDGGGANTAQRWVNRACWMGRQWIPAASSTQQITQHQHHPHPYLGGTSTSDGGGSSYMSGFRLISYNVLSDFKNAYQSHSTVKNRDTRRQLLLGEMLSYSLDVICL